MQGIYSPQTESQQSHWHRQPRGQWRIQQFPATGWLTLVLKKNKNTCSQSGVLKTLSFPNFSSRPTWALNEVYALYTWNEVKKQVKTFIKARGGGSQKWTFYSATEDSSKGNIFAKYNSRRVLSSSIVRTFSRSGLMKFCTRTVC